MSADLAIEPGDQFGERVRRVGERSETGLKGRHHHRGGDALAGDVGDGDEQRAIAGAKERVVIIAADGFRWARGEGDIDAGNVGRAARHEPSLDFASDLDVALHGNVIAEHEREQDQQSAEREEELDSLA